MRRMPSRLLSGLPGCFGASAASMLLPAFALAAVLLWLVEFHLRSDVPPPDPIYDLDVREYFYPALDYVRATLREGELPLWNPNGLAGFPFAASLQPAVYYPLLTPLLVLPTHVAMSVHLVLHLWIAGMLTWKLGRELGLGNIPSTVSDEDIRVAFGKR